MRPAKCQVQGARSDACGSNQGSGLIPVCEFTIDSFWSIEPGQTVPIQLRKVLPIQYDTSKSFDSIVVTPIQLL
jgi:hypothetical protein